MIDIVPQTPEIEQKILQVMTQIQAYEHFVQPVVLGVGGCGTQRQEIPEEPPCAPRTHLGSSQETHP